MRKIREVLRLRHEGGLSHRAIATSCAIGITTAREYIQRAKAAGLPWPLPPELDDAALEARLFPAPPQDGDRPLPDWRHLRRELSKKGVTLALLWHEYRLAHPNGYGYSRFCELYRAWAGTLEVTMRHEHKAGEKLFVDYTGHKMEVVNPQTGEVYKVEVFVAAQGASNYTYAEPAWSQDLPGWTGAHVRAFEFFGGVNAIIVPDNLKAGVTAPHLYEPDLNRTYADFARHYGCAVIPARSCRPRDKAKVEAAVQGVERWVMAPLRNRRFFSTGELKQAFREQLDWYNNRSFQKLDGSRRSLFETLDRPALKALPVSRYEFAQWKQAKVHVDYHVEVDAHRYSVPYQHVGRKVDVRLASATVEFFLDNKRIASHRRNPKKGGFTTIREHMPKSHQAHLDWTPGRLVRRAAETGPETQTLIERILASRAHPQQGFRPCLGIMRLGKRYGPERLEAACRRALAINSIGYKSVESILKNNLDQRPLPETPPPPPAIGHPNLRGPEYYIS
jgi:transposase